MKILPVIMSGGAGTRLWPLSRRTRPKQFINLISDKSLFQETILRLSDDGETFAPPLIIAGRGHEALVAAQLEAIGLAPSAVILEPCPRNTAAVAAVAAEWAALHMPDALILMSPADHHVEDTKGFQRAARQGAVAAERGAIVAFGIKPTRPHTGFGYIQAGGNDLTPGVAKVAAFHEKPDAGRAAAYLSQGNYFWNAGLFLFSAQTMRDALQALAPEILTGAKRALEKAKPDGDAMLLDERAFANTPAIAIDYAVMEKTDKAAVVAPVDIGWSDIGSWSETESQGADHVEIDCENLTLRSTGPIIGAIGVEDLVIVATGDAVLVVRKDHAQDVRKLVEELKARKREDLL